MASSSPSSTLGSPGTTRQSCCARDPLRSPSLWPHSVERTTPAAPLLASADREYVASPSLTRRSLCAAQPERLPLHLHIIFRELLDLEKLVLLHVREVLPRVAGRPPDLQLHDLRILSQPDMLLQWRRTK